ncbi:hypothetical protein [Thermosipho sp. (in: thermotogales)]|jgi:hypothetical protein|uniref:hypothetical protein n=1 Tax=Thermosipho sp. (in: thermotogales) TaxID=1968895 RepID=UPI00257B5E62|nr:hypothetical protein [Thermosipho sp. (in: thermotogales)]MBZ4649263.1 hypothetical protein [Thermosipho sp. (in: thermotogales)]
MKFKGIKFYDTKPLKFVKIVIDYYNHPELFEKDLEELLGDIENSVVHIDIKVSLEDNHKIDIEKIKQLTSKCFYCKEIVPSIVKQNKITKSRINLETPLMDAIRLFIKEKHPKGSNSVLALTEKLIKDIKLEL